VTLWIGLGGDPAPTLTAAPAWASSVGLPLSVPEMAARADVIVVGVVVGMLSAWDATANVINTVVDVRPEEVLKGASGTRVLRLRHLGGRVGDAAAVVAGAPTFVSGERVLLFLAGDPQGELAVVGLSQGKFTVTQDAAGRSVVRRTEVGARQEMSLEDVRDLIRRVTGG
jgi:hypothetical protein